jgi:AraC family transcriptional regulator
MFGVSPSQYRAGQHPLYSLKEIPIMTSTVSERPVRIETLPARRVAFIRHVGPYDQVGTGFQKLGNWAGRRGVFGPGTVMLGVCHDDPDVTAPEKLRYDCCVTVGDDVGPEGEVGVQVLEGGEHAMLTHRGPYSGLADAWRWLYGVWLPGSGREPRHAPPFEVYHNTPQEVPPEGLVTDICVPLEPR